MVILKPLKGFCGRARVMNLDLTDVALLWDSSNYLSREISLVNKMFNIIYVI